MEDKVNKEELSTDLDTTTQKTKNDSKEKSKSRNSLNDSQSNHSKYKSSQNYYMDNFLKCFNKEENSKIEKIENDISNLRKELISQKDFYEKKIQSLELSFEKEKEDYILQAILKKQISEDDEEQRIILVDNHLNKIVKNLEILLEANKSKNLSLLHEKENEIKELKSIIKMKIRESKFTIDTICQLREIIEEYRSLFKEQEKNKKEITGKRFNRSKKRKSKNSVNLGDSDAMINSFFIGPIAIDSSEKNFIKLVNKTLKYVSMGNYKLKRVNETVGVEFQFPSCFIISPLSYVTIWSLEASEAKHEPPVDFKLNEELPFGEEMITILINNNKEVVAKWEVSNSSENIKLNTPKSFENSKCPFM